MTRRRAWLATVAVLAGERLYAQVAILDSIAGSSRDGVWRLRFRTGPAVKMRVGKATLLLHMMESPAPDSIDILKPVKGRAEAQPQRDGWITVSIDPKCAQRVVDSDAWLEFRAVPAASFHLPAKTGFAPYLVLEGK